jgi:type I restriction-modification system DNA methylase subunit
MSRYSSEIIKELSHITSSGSKPFQIFEDYLDLTLATLEAMPAHVRSAVKERKPAEDTKETQALFAKLRERYDAVYFKRFSNAFMVLLDSTETQAGELQWNDTIGEAYMEWNVSNKYSGQYFTPYHVAHMMAVSLEIEQTVYERLEKAYLSSSTGAMHKFMSDKPLGEFVRKMGGDLVQLCVEHFEPIKVNDCACGSGVMLLAAAEQCPRWALNWGLVQFYGMDIDATCVKMAQINMMIYGLNGFNLKTALALAEADFQGIPEPFQSAYRDVQKEPERLEEIHAQVIEVNSPEQLRLL